MPKTQWERKEQQFLVQWFKLKYPDTLIVASANGGARNIREAANMKREGVLAGFPDIGIYKPSGLFHGLFIELKTPKTALHAKGRVSKLQESVLQRLNDNGYCAIACFGWLDAKEKIESYLREGNVKTIN